MLNIGVLGSTRGSVLPSLLTELTANHIAAKIVVIVSDRPLAGILDEARQLAIPNEYINPHGLSRKRFDRQLAACLQAYDVELVVMLGFMRIVSDEFIQNWPEKIINIHPSLLPKYAGLMDLAVHQAVLDAGDRQSGCSVHVVTTEVDAGPILIQKTCPIEQDDTATILKQRVQALEVPALAESIQHYLKEATI